MLNRKTKKVQFLICEIIRYRNFLIQYLIKDEFSILKELSNRLNIDIQNCYIKNIKTIDQCILILKELKQWKLELTGSDKV